MLRRLRHFAKPLNKSAFGFKKQSGTDDALANILSDIGPGSHSSAIVFLDLEKSFELANPAAILNNLANRNVKGKLLSWIKKILTERKANLKYQGAISDTMPLKTAHLKAVPSALLFLTIYCIVYMFISDSWSI